MKIRLLTLTFVLLPFILPQGHSTEIQHLHSNYIRLLLASAESNQPLLNELIQIEPETEFSDQMVVELHQRYPTDGEAIQFYLDELTIDGTWSDINYQDKKRSGWAPMLHAKRVLEMTKAYYSSHSTWYQQKELLQAIHQALNYWLIYRPQCLNWWYNEVGIPRTLGSVFILLFDELTSDQKAGAIQVMKQADFGRTGQNKVWLAGNVLIRAILERDMALAQTARNHLADEIVVRKQEGIQADWSFHQHGAQQQFGNYGLAFLTSMSFYSSLFGQTSLTFSSDELAILNKLIREGYSWIIWRGKMDINALGRQLFHNVPIHKGLSVGFAALELAQTGEKSLIETRDEFIQNNFPAPCVNEFIGHKHFWKSAYTIHRRPDWMASLKMSSTDIIGVETVNEDNLKGYYLGDGALYIYSFEPNYLNCFPFWDWRKIPGVTAYESSALLPSLNDGDTRNKSSLVGGCTIGDVGLSAMELNRDGLQAKKMWLFQSDFVFCLGGAITSASDSIVTTSIDQRIQSDELYHLSTRGWSKLRGVNDYKSNQERLIHAGIGYVVVGDSVHIIARSELKTGDWKDHMGMYTSKKEKEQLFTVYVNHGKKPQSANYSYYIIPNTTTEELEKFDVSQIQVIRNDATAQIVYLPQLDQYWGVAYKAFSLESACGSIHAISGGQLFSVIENKYYNYPLNNTNSDRPELYECND